MTAAVDALEELARPEHRGNPYPFLHWLRENDPVHRTRAGFYLISNYDDVFYTMQHTGTAFTVPEQDAMAADLPPSKRDHPSITKQLAAFAAKNMPHYTRLRSVMARDMTAARVRHLRPRIEEHLDRILAGLGERLAAGEVVDLHTEVSMPLTQFVFAERVGVPAEDKTWIADTIALMMQALVTSSEEVMLAADEASDQVEEYFRERVAERRQAPRDDMISRLVKVHDSYAPDDDRLLIAILWIMWMTGYESTIAGIDRGMQSYLDHAEYRDWLDGDEPRVQSFVEETLRHDGVVLYTPIPRIALDDVDMSDTTIPAGSSVRMLLASANRDPQVFPDPDRFDPTRNTHRMLNMGYGMFHCSGAALGRAEMAITLTGLKSRFPTLTAAETPTWSDIIETRCVTRLPARLA
ncbi:cytochrome P450 [Actinophytocola sp.]|uniref:cytochrome P450 n=1 Tax=Actinophytocola sp. TaxID=1872138 RepID=UPI002D27F4DB|nr:cytochrome P450 [Actinophytocola sp.]HYQ68133.1 cytochrome P450 [Actinophytocola sp.]